MKKILSLFCLIAIAGISFSQTISKFIYQDTVMRSYLIHLPPAYNASAHLPVVFNLHGSTSTGAQEEFYSRMSETADTNGFIVVYPDGLGNVWNSGFSAPYNGGVDDVGFISLLIDTISTAYHIDLNRVYACGMSNGGYQSFRLACDLENRIAAIASVTGQITDLTAANCALSRKIPVMIVHGTADPLVPYNGQTGSYSTEQTISFWLNQNQCSLVNDTTDLPDTVPVTSDSSTVQKIHYRSCASDVELLFYKITGGGHTWPNAPYHYIYGPTNHDIDGSTEIWKFFNRFTLNGLSSVRETEKEIALNIYPNPFTTEIKIEATGRMERIAVMNLLGEKVWDKKINSPSAQIDLAALQNGIYLLMIEANGARTTKRIVKE